LVAIVPSTGVSPRTGTVPRTRPQTRQVARNNRVASTIPWQVPQLATAFQKSGCTK